MTNNQQMCFDLDFEHRFTSLSQCVEVHIECIHMSFPPQTDAGLELTSHPTAFLVWQQVQLDKVLSSRLAAH